MEILIFGHKNPDTDSLCSALAYSEYKKALGYEVKACRLGSVNDETNFVLDYLNMEAPTLITNVEGKDVILVDHNEFNQSCDGIKEANVLEVIDHHRVNNFNTSEPIFMNVRPYGCTATIIFEIFKLEELEINKTVATLLVSAIISDTLLFKSPTCTKKDILAAKELAKIAEISFADYGMDLLKAGTDLNKYTMGELLNIDAKQFEISVGMAEVAQVNTVDLEEFVTNFEKDIETEINNSITKSGVKLYVLLVTDILNSNSLCYVYGEESAYFETKFGKELNNNKVVLDGVVSRKKQIVPYL